MRARASCATTTIQTTSATAGRACPTGAATCRRCGDPTPSWLASLGFRYSGRTFGRLENDDINGDTYGGISRMRSWDGRVAYTTANGTELALGIDNITDDRAYQSHPYPARTAFAEVRWSLGGAR